MNNNNNNNELIYWIWFSKVKKIGSIGKQKLLDIYKSPKNIWNLQKEELLKNNFINSKIADEILNKEYRENLNEDIKYIEENNIKLINIHDECYPTKLKNIYDKPITLYAKGNTKILNNFALAVIGCRQNTTYGKIVAQNIVKQLALRNIIVISGLAIGIDSIAHKETIKQKEKTIAVIGSGLDNIYPKQNIELEKEIIQNNGLILTEYPIGTKPEKLNFPARNRIISALSDGVIVVEAKKKSGTMITVDFALEQGKNVFAVPGNITSVNSEGTNELIKQGAKIITSMQDILEEY